MKAATLPARDATASVLSATQNPVPFKSSPRILQEEALKDGTAAMQAQVPVDVGTFLLNEKRNDIAKIESRHKIKIFLIPNKNLETPPLSNRKNSS